MDFAVRNPNTPGDLIIRVWHKDGPADPARPADIYRVKPGGELEFTLRNPYDYCTCEKRNPAFHEKVEKRAVYVQKGEQKTVFETVLQEKPEEIEENEQAHEEKGREKEVKLEDLAIKKPLVEAPPTPDISQDAEESTVDFEPSEELADALELDDDEYIEFEAEFNPETKH